MGSHIYQQINPLMNLWQDVLLGVGQKDHDLEGCILVYCSSLFLAVTVQAAFLRCALSLDVWILKPANIDLTSYFCEQNKLLLLKLWVIGICPSDKKVANIPSKLILLPPSIPSP